MDRAKMNEEYEKYKNEIKKEKKGLRISILIFILFLLLIFVLADYLYKKNTSKYKIKEEYKISIIEKKNCINEVIEYYSDNNQSIYFVCLEEVNLIDDINKVTLGDYIVENNKPIGKIVDELISKLVFDASLWDGGTQVYRDGSTVKYTDNGITVIKCNTIEGNNDLYIGDNDMDDAWGFNNGFCGREIIE